MVKFPQNAASSNRPAKELYRIVAGFVVILLVLTFFASPGSCQTAPAGSAVPPNDLSLPRREIKVYISNGELVDLSAPAAKMFVADPTIADIQVPSPDRVFIYGKKPGRTAFFALRADGTKSDVIDINVSYNTADLRRFLRQEIGDLEVSLEETPQGVILSGVVPSPEVAERVRTAAVKLAGEGNQLTNNLKLSGSTQVSIRVRIAEISRNVIKNLGVNWSAVGSTGFFTFGLTGSSVTPSSGKGANITAMLDALATEGLVSMLAEPTLTAVSGEKASFLAGGEFPIPVPSGTGPNLSVDYRKYGVSLDFIPTVLSDRLVSLYVRPEVSDLSAEGAVTVNGIQIPSLTSRRTETTVQLGSGQSLVVAGLIQHRFDTDIDKIAGAGDVPVLGALFRSTRFRKKESELIVVVTPYIVRPVSNPSAIALPNEGVEPSSDLERILQGKLARESKVPSPPVKLKGNAGFLIR